ncbi:alanine/glycine:cation symporter family protein [Synoicihabitans lomoniglobus]|uniref:Sodium:alanine symporter family protein n=1 Tax=Synoicihabitans lomoniglobus TaxID=2909285 RepID=A0AAF0A054_9BACT|nr:sodium:alanine symporter family protein [Opitutaceae bacterium LMO-M01]WED63997.1 sodium:alanine symporter family protein [Opitutaceae bacterium LMO-M01]
MTAFNDLISNVSNIVWGPPMLALIVLTGVFLTVRLRVIQLLRLGTGLRFAFGRKGRANARQGDISPFQALMTALAATIGTGNIVGVATAVSIGGPGALFWMWVIAFLGMATKYSEALLAVKYRIIDSQGRMNGGPMYYIERGMGAKWKPLAVAFAVFGAVAAFGIGNMVQANAVAGNIVALVGAEGAAVSTTNWVTGFGLAGLTALVILGGIKSIARTAAVLVPFMAIFYVIGCLYIILRFAGEIPAALSLIIRDGFNGSAAAGGFAGSSMILAMRMGVARGVFSNESGLGSASIAAAAAQTDQPAEQGLISMMGTFIDSIVVCSLTGLALVVTGVWTGGGAAAAAMTQAAFSHGLPGQSGGIVVGIAVITFAYSTVIGWSYYGERCCEYLFGRRAIPFYRGLWILAIMVGAVGGLRLIWNIADVLNALMALPNLIALIALSGVVVAETRAYGRR